VDYLGVAYADEGIELRKAGITVPVMVLNVDESSFAALIEYNLQPVLFSFPLLQQFEAYLNAQALLSWPVHLEIETGMNRLGFAAADTKSLATHIATSPLLKIESVFTHLAASEEPAQDAFTREQLQLFQKAIAVLQQAVPYPFLKHISNSAAISRHPELQLDMVRLGIGLYGIESKQKAGCATCGTLRSTIAQIKHLTPGESVSYNRRGVGSARFGDCNRTHRLCRRVFQKIRKWGWKNAGARPAGAGDRHRLYGHDNAGCNGHC
jgi:alanine racemase